MNKNTIDFFNKYGFAIFKLFSKEDIERLKSLIADKLNLSLSNKLIKFKPKDLRYYHKKIYSETLHKKIIDKGTRNINLNEKFIASLKKNKIINKIVREYWNENFFSIHWVGSLKHKQVGKNLTAFRIARPKSLFDSDVGGVHYDLPYGRKKNPNKDFKALLTIWVPLEGFNEKYTLRISPKSHKKKHPIKFISKQKKYVSPVFIDKYVKKFKFLRPHIKSGQAIIFHPNLLHGGSFNLGKNTRISLDFRIFNNKIAKFN